MADDKTEPRRTRSVNLRPRPLLSDLEFEEAIVTLGEGLVPFEAPEMLQRFAETVLRKIALLDEFSGEDG
jgi:hypothetical protein